jgi:transposase
MDHIAIDLGGKESQICIRASDGTIGYEGRHATAGLPEFLKRPVGRVVMETCAEAFAVADAAAELGHEVRVVPATLVRILGVGAHGIKTDRRDAQALSEVSCRIDLPSVHVPSQWSREMKSMCGMRESLVHARTQLVNTIRGWLRGQLKGSGHRFGGPVSMPNKLRALFESENLKVPGFVERQLQAIEHLNSQIKEAHQELEVLAEGSELCRRLMTVPGVGPLTALRFVSAIDRIDRFKSAHHLESYLGLTPGEDSSSDRRRVTSITKAGSAAARWILVQAAWCALRTRARHPMCDWAREVGRRRGTPRAIVALARKMAGILFALWRDGTRYDPFHRVEPVAASV